MSRSKRKAIIKDRPRNFKKSAIYWRRIRRKLHTILHTKKIDDDLELPDPKTIVNDYDHTDYILDFEHDKNDERRERYRRK